MIYKVNVTTCVFRVVSLNYLSSDKRDSGSRSFPSPWYPALLNGQGLGRRLVQAVAAHLAQHGMTALQIGCLAANAPARGFYEAIGGRLIGERLFDEDGVMLPEVVYAWQT